MRQISRAVMRLLILQASWTYERLQGVGLGYASLPLLEPLADQPDRYGPAVARASEYFNANPYLAGIAAGAAARAELDGVPGGTVQRLKTALAGPLGSLGDQLFWIGVLPAVMAAILIAVSFGAGLPAVGVGVGLYFGVRLYVTAWGTRLGYRSGLGVSAALKQSGLSDRVRRVGLLAGFMVGAMVPLVGHWLVGSEAWKESAVLGIGVAAGAVAALVPVRIPSARLVTLLVMAVVLLWQWS